MLFWRFRFIWNTLYTPYLYQRSFLAMYWKIKIIQILAFFVDLVSLSHPQLEEDFVIFLLFFFLSSQKSLASFTVTLVKLLLTIFSPIWKYKYQNGQKVTISNRSIKIAKGNHLKIKKKTKKHWYLFYLSQDSSIWKTVKNKIKYFLIVPSSFYWFVAQTLTFHKHFI